MALLIAFRMDELSRQLIWNYSSELGRPNSDLNDHLCNKQIIMIQNGQKEKHPLMRSLCTNKKTKNGRNQTFV